MNKIHMFEYLSALQTHVYKFTFFTLLQFTSQIWKNPLRAISRPLVPPSLFLYNVTAAANNLLNGIQISESQRLRFHLDDIRP